ncbi:hypothetical protein ACSMEV_05725 [Pseudomonas sp. MLB6B]
MGQDLIRHFLAVFFTEEAGLTEAQAIEGFLAALAASGRKEELHCDLIDMFEDEDTAWRTLLWNGEYQVKAFACEAQAKAYVRTILWEPLFWPQR